MTSTISPKIISLSEELPPEGRSVIVVCRNVQLLGYMDDRRIWREEVPPHRKLDDVVGWYDEAV